MKGAVWIGLVIMLPSAAGIFSILSADSETFDLAPRWTVFSGALAFFNAGITVGLMDSGFNDFRDKTWFAYFHFMALLSIPLILLMLFNWVALGPGEREFSMEVSIPFLSFNFDRANEIIGRIVFGIFALLGDAFLVYIMYALIGDTFKKHNDNIDSDVDQVDSEK